MVIFLNVIYVYTISWSHPAPTPFLRLRQAPRTNTSFSKILSLFFHNLLILVSVALLSTGVGSPTGTLATYQTPPCKKMLYSFLSSWETGAGRGRASPLHAGGFSSSDSVWVGERHGRGTLGTAFPGVPPIPLLLQSFSNPYFYWQMRCAPSGKDEDFRCAKTTESPTCFSSLCGAGAWTWGLSRSRNALCHWSTSPALSRILIQIRSYHLTLRSKYVQVWLGVYS